MITKLVRLNWTEDLSSFDSFGPSKCQRIKTLQFQIEKDRWDLAVSNEGDIHVTATGCMHKDCAALTNSSHIWRAFRL